MTLRWEGIISALLLIFINISLPGEVPFQLCCNANQALNIQNKNSIFSRHGRRYASCANSRGVPSLDLSQTMILALNLPITDNQEERFVESVLKNVGTTNLKCANGLEIYVLHPLHYLQGGEDEPVINSNSSNFDIRLIGSPNENEGNVIVNGKHVCDDSWDNEDAKVACRMLGYMEGQPTSNSAYGQNHGGDYGMDDVNCSGDENSLFECRYNARDDCGASEAAGVICTGSLGPKNTSFAINGDLITSNGDTVLAGSFCLASDYKNHVEVMAVRCRMAQVSTGLLDIIWNDIQRGPGNEFVPEYSHLATNFVALGDKDNSGTMSEDEFKSLIKSTANYLVNIVDENGSDGIELIEVNVISDLPFNLFDATLKKVFDFWDLSKDDILSFNDDFPSRKGEDGFSRYDRDRDGVVSLEDIFRSRPITWPHPVYRFYSTLDADRNGELSREEARSFLRKTFAVIDHDEDCKISMEDLSVLCNNLGIPKSYGLAMEILLHPYFKLSSYILTELISKGDINKDGKVTLEEIWAIDDWDWFETMATDVASLGQPNVGPLYLMAGERRGLQSPHRREHQAEVVEMLLTALLTLMEQPGYSTTPTSCSNMMHN